jgi:hypothetical protein
VATVTDDAVSTEDDVDAAVVDEFNKTADKDGKPEDEKTIEELASERTPTPPMQLALDGTMETISTAFGGARPTESEIRLLGGKMPINGSFQKGEVLDLLIRVKVTGTGGFDTVDAFGEQQKTTRRHFARMIEVKLLSK